MAASAPATMKLNHGTVAWREAGAGAPLVFLHGLVGNSRQFLPLFARLSRDFRVIAWDCPGYGGSDQLPIQKPTAHDYGDALAAFLDGLEIEKAAIVGDWLGGLIAGALAGKAAERVALLVGSGMKAKPTEQEANDFLVWIQELMTTGGTAFGAAFADKISAPGGEKAAKAWIAGMAAELNPIGFGRACHMIANTDASELFKIVRAPLFLVYGEHDPLAPAAEARALERVVRGTVTEIMAGAGHMPTVEKPDLFSRSLRGFLRAVRYR